MFTYLILNLLTISVPLIRSFEPKINYVGKWKQFFIANSIVAAFFIIWDVWFTKLGVWSFSYDYTLGFRILGLPFEEWLFFIAIPFACVFIYLVLQYFVKEKSWFKNHQWVSIALGLASVVIAVVFYDRMYTTTTFSLLGVLLLLHGFVFKKAYMAYFYIGYAIALIPFAIVNGILTAKPVVMYNDVENLGIRLHTIPVEDVFYGMLLILLNVTIYEWLMSRKVSKLRAK